MAVVDEDTVKIETAGQPDRAHKTALRISIFISGALFAAKLPVGMFTGSAAVLASALDSLFDFFASSGNLFALHTASRPADDNHRFGHGKAEALASLLQSLIISASALYLVYQAALSFAALSAGNVEPGFEDTAGGLAAGLWVMGFSLTGTGIIIFFQTRALKAGGSDVVAVDRLHYLTDFLSGIVVIAALVVSRLYNILWVDLVGAALVAGYLLFAAAAICIRSVNILMDKDISYLYRESLDRLVADYKNVLGYHDLKSHAMGRVHHVYFHLEMQKDITFEQSHRIVEELSARLNKEFGGELKIMIHADPVIVRPDGRHELLDRDEPEFY